MSRRTKGWTPIADVPNIAPSTLRRWCAKGRIRAKKFGKLWYIHISSLIISNSSEL